MAVKLKMEWPSSNQPITRWAACCTVFEVREEDAFLLTHWKVPKHTEKAYRIQHSVRRGFLVVGQLGLFYRLWHLQSCVQGHLHKEEITLGSKLRHPPQRAFVKAKCRQMTWKGLRDCRSKFKSRLLMKMMSSLRNEQVSFPFPSWILWDWEARCLYLFPNLATSCRYLEGR